MASSPVTAVQRSVGLLAGALLLPTLVLLGALLFTVLTAERRGVEQEALAQAGRLLSSAEARLTADRAALRVLSTSQTVHEGNEADFQVRATEILALNPGWRHIRVIPDVEVSSRPEVIREGDGCPCLLVSEKISTRPGYSVQAAISPDDYQVLTIGLVKPPSIAALVDHDGRFLARTINYSERVGTSATEYVKRAIVGGEAAGFYRGVTHEGLANYTAFVRSPVTGWSAHVAVQRSAIDRPRTWLQAAGIFIALLTLLIAVALVVSTVRDLNLRRQEAQSLLELQRAEAMSQFTSGVAHDFRNMLTVIIGNLDRVLGSAQEPNILMLAGRAMDAAKRGERLSNQLLSFARTDGADVTIIDLPEMFTQIGDLLRQSAGLSVVVEWEIAPEAETVKANRDQLELALVNLVVNARDAMSGSGLIKITSQLSDGRVELIVSDNGPGVPEELKSRLFEPFFTTKPVGKGTGLGLAQVAGAVRHAGGAVRIEEAPGGGAAFVLVFPA
ncbi:sensor histidine kinase [Phenylobacterium sp.]|uniref:sensor histidine kinase n=1 Tax=Phenylobacterium sp. TaxID=1871053 RepID=UPI00272FA0F8|nr:ATP-binding protein [Phenylobacterium sp.]MDP2212778.1 ATP-binding protein [Phenylobacterium sp.]